jgi:hypothetical protein
VNRKDTANANVTPQHAYFVKPHIREGKNLVSILSVY